MTGNVCPECGTDERAAEGPDGRPGTEPGCGCAERAARRAASRAETAAAEDFDPLRIRPYVIFGDDGTVSGTTPEEAVMTMPLPLDRAATTDPPPAPPEAPEGPEGPEPAALRGSGGTERPGTDTVATVDPPDPVQPRRRRPFSALAIGAAVVAVVGTAAFAGGLFDGDGPGRPESDRALPSTAASAAPDASLRPDTAGSASASSSTPSPASASPSASASASVSVSASEPTSAEPSASASAPSSRPATPSATDPAAQPTRSPSLGDAQGSSLRRGDHGPAVAELQRRLQEVWLYLGPDDGDYTDRVERAVRGYQSAKHVKGDQPGVYGPNTRRALEAETTGRGRF
ncbi:peptidoglycan-binding protein [Streptomyces sp. LN785]|uniref:peptidoglycan-binding domain-containing protein n=1 Tax=Streptomyces sp. LN785 TaxID=3112983 RepID=UPI00371076CA